MTGRADFLGWVMNVEADGLFGTVLAHINWVEVVTTLLISAVLSILGFLSRKFFTTERKIAWTVMYDEPINIGTRTVPELKSGPGPADETWDIVYRSKPDAPKIDVKSGSLAVVEFRNVGKSLTNENFGHDVDQPPEFKLVFPNRRVVHWKIRDNDEFRERDQRRTKPAAKSANHVRLPAFESNRGDAFKVVVLLTRKTKEDSVQDGDDTSPNETIYVAGHIHDGKFEKHEQRTGKPYRPARIAGAIVCALLLFAGGGWSYGVWLTGRALTPAPRCAGGTLQIDGSTAFAPIAKEIATEYEQDCQSYQPVITVNAVGSVAGLTALMNEGGRQIIAMYDGKPDSAPPSRYLPHPVGWVIFAVVGNRSSLPANDFLSGTGNGLTDNQVEEAFNQPAQSVVRYAPVGRSSASGTRETFTNIFLGGADGAESAAKACPAPAGTGPSAIPGSVCLEPTTMRLLEAVDTTPDAIGYAEADALPFFPGVGAITINGYEPTRANTLSHAYTFGATEHLYTDGTPAADTLTADFLSFLQSAAVTAQLRDTSFISCADLAGSAISDACNG